MRLFSNRSQRTSKCGKNISDTLGCASCATFLFLPHFVICDLLLSRRTATWNLFVNYSSVSIDWHVPSDNDVVVVIVHQSLWLMLLLQAFVCNLYIMIFTVAPVEIYCSIIVPGDVLRFIKYLTCRYNLVLSYYYYYYYYYYYCYFYYYSLKLM